MFQLKRTNRSGTEFKNPFYVIMHVAEALRQRLDPSLLEKTLLEIEEIKGRYEFVEHDQDPASKILPLTPKNRPVLVCGFFAGECVEVQRDSLERHGYEAYISKEGVYGQ